MLFFGAFDFFGRIDARCHAVWLVPGARLQVLNDSGDGLQLIGPSGPICSTVGMFMSLPGAPQPPGDCVLSPPVLERSTHRKKRSPTTGRGTSEDEGDAAEDEGDENIVNDDAGDAELGEEFEEFEEFEEEYDESEGENDEEDEDGEQYDGQSEEYSEEEGSEEGVLVQQQAPETITLSDSDDD